MGKTMGGALAGGMKRLLALPLLTLAILAALLTAAAQDPPQASANHSTEKVIWSSTFVAKRAHVGQARSVGCTNEEGFKCGPTTHGALPNSNFSIGSTTYNFLQVEFDTHLPARLIVEIDQKISKRQRDNWTFHLNAKTVVQDVTKGTIQLMLPFSESTTEFSEGENGKITTTLYWSYDGTMQSVDETSTKEATVKITQKSHHAGELDPAFGIRGKIATALQARDSQINDIAIQEDGKIVAVGYVENGTVDAPNKDFALARYLPDGTLDSSFGNGGKVITEFGSGDDIANGVAIQSDGKIVAVGKARALLDVTNDNDDLAIARYKPNGELDPNFGTGGKKAFGRGPTEIGYAVEVQSDGKIVVAGRIAADMAVWRYLADGSKLDTDAFNKDATPSVASDTANHPTGPGFVRVSWGTSPGELFEEARAMVLHKDESQTGKIVVAGRSESEFAIARIKPNGTLDTGSNGFDSNGRSKYAVSNANGATARAFSLTLGGADGSVYMMGGYLLVGTNSRLVIARHRVEDGKLICWNPGAGCSISSDSHVKVNKRDFDGIDQATAIAQASHDKDVIVAGFAGTESNGYNFGIGAFWQEGATATNFGVGGQRKTDVAGGDDQLFALEVLPDGSLIGAGYASLPNPGYVSVSSHIKHFTLIKYSNFFGLDSGFGVDGIVTTPFGVGINRIEDIKVLADDKILAVGSLGEGLADLTNTPYSDMLVARFNSNGTLDTTFAINGRAAIDRSSDEDRGYALAVQSDGKILVAGLARVGQANTSGLQVVRLTSSGTVDTDFGDSGRKQVCPLLTCIDRFVFAKAMTLDSTDKIILAGTSRESDGVRGFGIGRLTAAGEIDTSFSTDGKARIVFNSNTGLEDPEAVAVDSNGKIVVAGWTEHNSDGDTKVAIARLTAAGALDTAFGTGGKVQSAFGTDFAKANALVLDGNKIMIAGRMGTKEDGNFLLARYSANGTLDTTFNDTGYVEIDIGSKSNEVHDLKRTAAGEWILVGSSGVGDDAGDLAIARVRADGSIDGHFGLSGTGTNTTKLSNESEAGLAVDLDSKGNIVVGGTVVVDEGEGGTRAPRDYFALARYFGRVAASADTRLNSLAVVPRKDNTDGTESIIRTKNSGSLFAYSATLPAGNTHFKLRPTAAQSGATISITPQGGSKVTVTSGAKSSAFAIAESTTVTATMAVTSSDGNTEQSYTVEIIRPANPATTTTTTLPSTDASLSSVVLKASTGTSFTNLATINSPSASSTSSQELPRDVTHVRFAPTATAGTLATITASWQSQSSVTIASGSNSQTISVTVDTDLSIDIEVTPESGTGAQTYTINLTWEAAPPKSTDAGLDLVTVEAKTASTSFTFVPNVKSFPFTVTLEPDDTHFKFTPTADAGTLATISYSWQSGSTMTITSGMESPEIAAPADENASDVVVTITVTAEDTTTSKNYVITFTKKQPTQQMKSEPIPNDRPTTTFTGSGGPPPAPANEAPTFAEESYALTIEENSSAGSLVGEPITATDADGDSITYALEGEGAELFEIDSSTGQITVAEGAELDFEAETNEFTLTITATDEDGSGESATAEVSINLTDVELPDVVAPYDANFDEQLDLQELLAALRDFVEGKLTLPQITSIILHFLSN